MTEEKKKHLIGKTALAASTITGILGAITAMSAVQVIAYFPAVVENVILEHCSRKENIEKSLHSDLKAAISGTCVEVQNKIERISIELASFFQITSMGIVKDTQFLFSAESMKAWIRDAMKKEEKWECPEITERDMETVIELFLGEFVVQLLKYPRLAHFLTVTAVFDLERRVGNLENEVLEQKMINNEDITVLPENICGDVEDYKTKYEEVLFLHRNFQEDKQISLKNIFVMPSVTLYSNCWSDIFKYSESGEAIKVIKDFVCYNPIGEESVDFMFIEGQAAMGKSSLVSWLAWQYCCSPEKIKKYLDGKRLIVIRLRDLLQRHEVLNVENPLADLTEYLYEQEISLKKQKEIEKKLYKDTVLVLDGFDELCMVESIYGNGKNIYFYNMYREFRKLNCACKIIVTTRPSYLDVESLDFPKVHIEIKGFSIEKRREWMEKYEEKEYILPEVKSELLEKHDRMLECLLESPMTLYMIIVKKIVVGKSLNMWDLYHKIFAEEIYERNYDEEGAHSTWIYKKYLYELTAEIANAVCNEKRFFITVEKLLERKEVKNLVKKLDGLQENRVVSYEKIQNILEDCFGVASYFKISKKEDKNGLNKNAVEFYHNNIRDYFYCEYIWMNLQRIYRDIQDIDSGIAEKFISEFQMLFQHSAFLDNDVISGAASIPIQFFQDKVCYIKQKNITENFIIQELKNRYFKYFFGKMLRTGFLYSYEYNDNENILNLIANVYSAVFSIYHAIYLPFLSSNEKIELAEMKYIEDINRCKILKVLFFIAAIKEQTYLNFSGMTFEDAECQKYNFSYSSFEGCIMAKSNFRGCNLSNANLSHANLSYADLGHANLSGADLRGTELGRANLQNADLRNARIDRNTIFDETIFGATKISKEQLLYIGEKRDGELIIC